jgi:hypothetical protein
MSSRLFLIGKVSGVEYFNCLDSFIINDERFTREIKSTNDAAKASFKRKNVLSHQQIGIKLREETSAVLQLDYSFLCC